MQSSMSRHLCCARAADLTGPSFRARTLRHEYSALLRWKRPRQHVSSALLVLDMNMLDSLEMWVRSLRNIFEAAGVEVRFDRTTDARPKHSAVLNLRRGSTEADLVVWDSGEADLSTMENDGSANQQHFENLRKPEDLALVLSKVASVMRLTAQIT